MEIFTWWYFPSTWTSWCLCWPGIKLSSDSIYSKIWSTSRSCILYSISESGVTSCPNLRSNRNISNITVRICKHPSRTSNSSVGTIDSTISWLTRIVTRRGWIWVLPWLLSESRWCTIGKDGIRSSKEWWFCETREGSSCIRRSSIITDEIWHITSIGIFCICIGTSCRWTYYRIGWAYSTACIGSTTPSSILICLTYDSLNRVSIDRTGRARWSISNFQIENNYCSPIDLSESDIKIFCWFLIEILFFDICIYNRDKVLYLIFYETFRKPISKKSRGNTTKKDYSQQS